MVLRKTAGLAVIVNYNNTNVSNESFLRLTLTIFDVFFAAAGLGACNDWKVLDPAIVSSSRHFPLANMTPLHETYNLQQQRSYNDYNTTNNSFTNFSQQLQQQQQQQPNGFNFLNTQQNLNWLGNELNSQISSPPGFRGTAQATKQQEC